MSQVESRQGLLGVIRERVKHRLVLHTILRVLGSRGIEIVPYYLTQESLEQGIVPTLDPEMGPVTAWVLSPAEIEDLFTHPEANMMGDKERLLTERCFCFGLKLKGEIAACMWCNVHRCHSGLTSFPLKENEAYLCSAVTFKAYRGRNLAPFLRYELHRHLKEMGRTKLYSITESFNTPALKFKEKLGAKQLKLGLSIRLFNRWQWNMTLRRYGP